MGHLCVCFIFLFVFVFDCRHPFIVKGSDIVRISCAENLTASIFLLVSHNVTTCLSVFAELFNGDTRGGNIKEE